VPIAIKQSYSRNVLDARRIVDQTDLSPQAASSLWWNPRKLAAAVSMQRTTDYADSVPESSSNVDNGVCNRFT
jgi:hypothetical protein